VIVFLVWNINQARPIEAMRSASIPASREIARRARARAGTVPPLAAL
jgi:hypothetical protein